MKTMSTVTEAISYSRNHNVISNMTVESDDQEVRVCTSLAAQSEGSTDAGDGIREFWGADWRVHVHRPVADIDSEIARQRTLGEINGNS